MQGLVLCVLFLATVGRAIAKPRIVSSPDFVTVYAGQAVMFRCQVYDPQNSLMSWSSVTHNLTIYNGSRLLVTDNTRYSLIQVAGGQQYNLQILYVEKSDEGSYKCAIQGTDQQLISRLRVLDMPSTALTSGISRSSTKKPSTVLTSGISHSSTSRPPQTQANTTSDSLSDMPTELMVINADSSAHVLLTWDMEHSTPDTRFAVFYKTLGDEQYTVVANITFRYYLFMDLKPQTFYTAFVVAKRGSDTDSPPSKQVQFVTGSDGVPNDRTVASASYAVFYNPIIPEFEVSCRRLAGRLLCIDFDNDSGDDKELILGIAIGATVAAVVLVVMVLLVVCFIYKGRIKGSIEFANPEFSSSKANIKY